MARNAAFAADLVGQLNVSNDTGMAGISFLSPLQLSTRPCGPEDKRATSRGVARALITVLIDSVCHGEADSKRGWGEVSKMADEQADIADFSEILRSLVRGDGETFAHFLLPYETPLVLDSTRATVRTHFVAADVNGAIVVDRLAAAVARAAFDFCIPRARAEEALAAQAATGSFDAIARLQEQTRELFVDSEKSGEGGELLLFLLMERFLQLPQLLAKMSLKTNANVHVHGSDGVHARLNGDVLDLYWGESKLYKDSSDAFTDCFASIAPFLGADDSVRARDLILVRENLNVTQVELATHLLEFLDDSNPKSLSVRWNGVCLIGFDYGDYPNLPSLEDGQRAIVSSAVGSWRKSVAHRIGKHSLNTISIDVFCLPVPDVEEFRKAIRRHLGVKP